MTDETKTQEDQTISTGTQETLDKMNKIVEDTPKVSILGVMLDPTNTTKCAS